MAIFRQNEARQSLGRNYMAMRNTMQIRLAQNSSDPLTSQRPTLGQCFCVAAITIIFRIGTKTGANRIRFDVSGQGPAAFEQNALKAIGPEHPAGASWV
jgi:hypothetical protein